MAEDAAAGRLSLLIKPDDIAGIGDAETTFLKLIREWKIGITEIIARKALVSFGLLRDDWRGKLNEYGGKFIDFLQSTFKTDNYANLSGAKRAIVDDFLKNGKIFVYLDDLDRGWQGNPQDVKKLSALLNAVRDLASECKGVCFRISLRSDVFYLVRTSDESTDKIEGSVLWYAWTNHEILAMLVKRIEHYHGRQHTTPELVAMNQVQLARFLPPRHGGRISRQRQLEKYPHLPHAYVLDQKAPEGYRQTVHTCCPEYTRQRQEHHWNGQFQ
jgi:hypothetical protein